MDVGLIQTILNVILGVVAVAVSIVAIRRAKRKRPIWCYKQRHIIGREAEAPSELRLMFGSKEVSDVYKTTIVFLNAGSDIIESSDVAEKVLLHFGEAEILKEPLVKVNREAVHISAKQVDGENAVQLEFDWLGHHDGAIIEVWHNKDTSVTLSGDFKNVGMTQLKEPVTARREDFRGNIFTTVAGLTFLGLIWRELTLDLLTPGIDWTLVGGAIIFTIFIGIILWKTIPRLYRYLMYPSWARFQD